MNQSFVMLVSRIIEKSKKMSWLVSNTVHIIHRGGQLSVSEW